MKIISGGQTGVDRAALDAGLKRGIPIGGACPKGRLAEDGPIDAKYPLKETATSQYAERTRKNVADADATLILYMGDLSAGTALTHKIALELGKPLLVVDLQKDGPELARNWLKVHSISVLNIAGPRESTHPGIYVRAVEFLLGLFT